MSRLTDLVSDTVKLRHHTDSTTGVTTTRAELCLFTENRSMRGMSSEQQGYIDRHLAKTLAHYVEDLAYKDFSKLLYELHRDVSMRTGYDADLDKKILKLKDLIQ